MKERRTRKRRVPPERIEAVTAMRVPGEGFRTFRQIGEMFGTSGVSAYYILHPEKRKKYPVSEAKRARRATPEFKYQQKLRRYQNEESKKD